MAQSHGFVPPKDIPELKEPRLSTLIRRRAILKAEVEVLEAKLKKAEDDLRAAVGLGYSMVTKTGMQWYEVTCAQETHVLLDRKKVARLLSPSQLRRCQKNSHRNVLAIKQVSKDYVQEEYDIK